MSARHGQRAPADSRAPADQTVLTMRDKAGALARQGFRVSDSNHEPNFSGIKILRSSQQQSRRGGNGVDRVDGVSRTHNIGISTDDLLVIDVDNKEGKGGDASCQFFIENGLELSDLTTVEARTLQVDETYFAGCRMVPTKKPARGEHRSRAERFIA